PGCWAIVIDVRDPETNERKRRWHSFKGTKREAQVECARLVSEAQQSAAVNPSRITLDQFLDRFEADWACVHVSAQTFERYRSALKPVRRALGDRSLQKLRAADLAQLYASMVRAGKSPGTIRLQHAIVHRAMETAKAWGRRKANPADQAKPPKVQHKETGILQPDDLAALLDRLKGGRLWLLAAVGLGTGMRRNEMLALRWCDIDIDAGQLTIQRALEQTVAHGVRIKQPKTKHGRRTVSLPASLVEALRSHRREQQERRLAMGLGKLPEDSPVFAGPDGKHMSPGAVTAAWRYAVPEISLHSLRHSHASMLIASGTDVLTISR